MSAEPVLGSPHRMLNRLETARPRAIVRLSCAGWLAVATVCIGALMGQLDASIVAAALPGLAADLHTSHAAVSWVSLSYLMALVAFVAPAGVWADAVGRKGLYVLGFAVFTVASAGCALAPDLGVLCALRVVQGAGAALLQANSVAIVTGSVPPSHRARALGVQAAAQAIGLAAGPAVGGLLLAAGSWRLLFVVTVPMGLVGVVTGLVLLPRSRDLAPRPRVLGAPLLRDRAFRRGLARALVGFAVLFGVLVAVPLWLTAARHLTAAHAAIVLTALPVGVGCAALVAGRAAHRHERGCIAGGLLLAGLAGAGVASQPNLPVLVGLLAVVGLGIGLLTPANTAALMARAPASAAGSASGLVNMTRALGTAVGTGLSALAVLVASRPGTALSLVTGVLAVAAVATATLGLRSPSDPPGWDA